MAEKLLEKLSTWILLALFAALLIFAFYSPAKGFMGKIGKAALGVAESFMPTEPAREFKQDPKQKEWLTTLSNYEKNKCALDKYTCKITNPGCLCFSLGEYNVRGKPDICDEKKPYCYDKEFGCSDRGPDVEPYRSACQKTNKDFQVAPLCEVDRSTCVIKNAPCSCYPKTGNPLICSEGQYCYNQNIGCNSENRPIECKASTFP